MREYQVRTTVIVDGGWCKRSHRHTYNAKSGVGVIIGFYTHTLVYEIKNAQCVPKGLEIISVLRTGMRAHLQWRETKCWRDSSNQRAIID